MIKNSTIKRTVSLLLALCVMISGLIVTVSAEEKTKTYSTLLKAKNKTQGAADVTEEYNVLVQGDTVYAKMQDIAQIAGYNIIKTSVTESQAEKMLDENIVLSKSYSETDILLNFNNSKFEFYIFSRKKVSGGIDEILYRDGIAVTMHNKYEIDNLKHNGEVYLNLEKMLYLMHAQWFFEDGTLYYIPLGDNIFNFIYEKFDYIYKNTVQRKDLLKSGESKIGHSTRVVLSHIINDIDMRIFLPHGDDMIEKDNYETAILQSSNIDEERVKKGKIEIEQYLKDSHFKTLKTSLNLNGIAMSKVDDLKKLSDTKLSKFSKWSNFSKINAKSFDEIVKSSKVMDKGLGYAGYALDVTEACTKVVEVAYRSSEWNAEMKNAIEILAEIDDQSNANYEQIKKAAESLKSEYTENGTAIFNEFCEEAITTALTIGVDVATGNVISSVLAVANASIKSVPAFKEALEMAAEMYKVSAMINVENVFFAEFIDNYNEFLYLSNEMNTNTDFWKLTSKDNSINEGMNSNVFSEMRTSLETFLKFDVKNKLFVCEYKTKNNDWPGANDSEKQKAKEAYEAEIYKCFGMLQELLNTRDYDMLLYVDKDFENMYTEQSGCVREKIKGSTLTNDKSTVVAEPEKVPSESSPSVSTPPTSNVPKGYIEISTPEELSQIREGLDKKYILTNDIDLSGYSNWEPIGVEYNYPFTGELEGNGYCIRNLNVFLKPKSGSSVYYDPYGERGAGLFGYVKGATIKNLGIEGGTITVSTMGNGSAGAFIGVSKGGGTTISNCYVNATVKSEWDTSVASSSAGMSVGAFIGSGPAKITNSYCLGSANAALGVYADQNLGGFIGTGTSTEEDPIEITGCYTLALMTGHWIEGGRPGAFVGHGYPMNNIKITNAFYATDSNKYNTVRVAVTSQKDEDHTNVKGVNLEELKSQATFIGFDFENTWAISASVNGGYPYLRSQKSVSMILDE